MRHKEVLTVMLAALATAAPASAQQKAELPTNRTADPVGRITVLQSFPTGGTASPDGKWVLAIAGPVIQGGLPAGPTGGVTLMLVDAATGLVRDRMSVDDAFQSVVFARSGKRAWVAGGTTGTVHVIDIGALGRMKSAGELDAGGFASGLALTSDEHNLWVAEPQADRVVRLNLGGGAPRLEVPAPAPDELALSPAGDTLYATYWRGGSVTAIDTAGGAARAIPVGAHPTGIAVHPDGRVLVTNSDDATLSTVAPDGRTSLTQLAQVGGRNDAPNAVAVGPDGRVYVTLGADNAVAVLVPRPAPAIGWRVKGLIPTGWYPIDLTLSPDGHTLHVVTGRGLAHSAAATFPYIEPDPVAVIPDGAYGTAGTLETIALPDAAGLAADTSRVGATLAPRAQGPPAGIDAAARAIKHVIYVTRENKTYDADLGDLHPGPGAALAVFGQTVTPNLHALERQFVESQNFSYQGFASVVGHFWEDAGTVSDVYERAVASGTGAHFGHASTSWHDPTNFPATGLITEQAWKAGLTVRTYNQETAQEGHVLPEELQADTSVFPNFDLAYPDRKREEGWETEFAQFVKHRCKGELATAYGASCALPALEYVYLGEDHTTVVDEPGYPTIEAQVADNDYATGKLIDAVSHSPYWKSTLVIVVEDDPQGTGDHVSAYRGLVALASPYVKRRFITLAPYNLTSAVGAIDRMLELPPLTDYARTSRPLDDAFTTSPDQTPFQVDGSGIALYPFTPLPGVPPRSDAAHGIYSFTEPDATDPAISGPATWRQVQQHFRTWRKWR